MIALEGVTECLIALTLPDGCDWFLKDVAENSLFPIFFSTSMPKGSEATGENVTTRSDIGQCIGPPASRPGPLTKVADEALQGSGRAGGIESNPALLANLLALLYQLEF